MADELVADFAEYVGCCGALLVHCAQGINRSQAVAIGLNDVFDLGHATGFLKEQYSATNWYVYEQILKAGKRLGPRTGRLF